MSDDVVIPRRIFLAKQPDGSLIDWGRHGPAREGRTAIYCGEAAEVMHLVLFYSQPHWKREQRDAVG